MTNIQEVMTDLEARHVTDMQYFSKLKNRLQASPIAQWDSPCRAELGRLVQALASMILFQAGLKSTRLNATVVTRQYTLRLEAIAVAFTELKAAGRATRDMEIAG